MFVAGLAEDGHGVLTGGDRLVEPAHLAQGDAEVAQRDALVGPGTEAAGSVQADGRGGDPVVEPAPQLAPVTQSPALSQSAAALLASKPALGQAGGQQESASSGPVADRDEHGQPGRRLAAGAGGLKLQHL